MDRRYYGFIKTQSKIKRMSKAEWIFVSWKGIEKYME